MKEKVIKAKPEKSPKAFTLLIRAMTKKNKIVFALLMACCLLASVAVLIPTQLVSIIISKLVGDPMSFFGIIIPDSMGIVAIIILAFVVTVVANSFRSFYRMYMELLIVRVVANVRKQAYGWIITPRKNMDLKMTEGDAAYRINDSCENIINTMNNLFRDIIPRILTGVVAFVYICLIDPMSIPIIIGGLLLVTTCVVVRTKLERPITVGMEISKSSVTNSIVNSINNLSIINLYKSMGFEQRIFDSKIENYYKHEKKFINLRLFYWQAVRFVEFACTFGIVALCVLRSVNGMFIAGNIVIIVNYISQLFSPIQDIGYFTSRLVQTNIKLTRLQEIRPKTSEVLSLLPYEEKAINSIELKNVNIQNGDIFMIKDVNLNFYAGQLTVMMGESGCGKSTIIRVLCGLCERIDGDIVINGEEKVDSMYPLTDYMSVTMQSPYIFNRAVKDNILYPDLEVSENANKMISTLKMEELYERGYNELSQQNLESMLSGGEKKRICISRGLLRPAKIYIFDEPTNDLDHKNAQNVIKYIEECKNKGIVIVVSHDKRIIDKADQVVVLNNKVLIETDGTLEDDSFYKMHKKQDQTKPLSEVVKEENNVKIDNEKKISVKQVKEKKSGSKK